MIFAMACPRNTEKALDRMDSADSFLPFQDWRWLVTRPVADEKPMIAHGAVTVFLRIGRSADGAEGTRQGRPVAQK
jgi:hypothetical protein